MCRARALLVLCVLASAARADTFDAIIAAASPRDRLEVATRMEAWAAAHPTDLRAPRGLVWAAQLDAIASDLPRARALFEQVRADYPGTDWALEASKGLADLALREHHFSQALEGYRALAARPEPFWSYTGRMALQDAKGEELRFAAMLAIALGLVFGWGIAFARAGIGRLWPWPEELVYAGPLLGLLALAAFGQPGPERGAVLTVALGGAALLWLNGAWMRARPPSRGRLWRATFGLAQAVGLLFCAFAANGLWGKLMDTITMGVDR